MARSSGDLTCHLHTALVSFEVHHVWPTAMHGPDIPSNRVKICCNAHSDVHHLLHRLLSGKPVDLREYGLQVRVIAQRGYAEVTAYADSLAPSP